ncbi:MAG TPA: hypothetical protein PLQ35_10295 [bacterium]|nr:hypothetical protein [bacterium]HQL62673.1 hypothetical protein [bacterium]
MDRDRRIVNHIICNLLDSDLGIGLRTDRARLFVAGPGEGAGTFDIGGSDARQTDGVRAMLMAQENSSLEKHDGDRQAGN